MKTKAELNELESEVAALREKLIELSEDELDTVSSGIKIFVDKQRCIFCGEMIDGKLYKYHIMECVKKHI